MQADEREAARRTAARAADRPAADLANKPAGEAPFDEDDWMAEEIPFNADQRTRERPETIVCGTPEIPYDPRTQVVIAPPPVTSPHQDPALAENLIRPGEARARGRAPHVYGCCWPCTGLPVAVG